MEQQWNGRQIQVIWFYPNSSGSYSIPVIFSNFFLCQFSQITLFSTGHHHIPCEASDSDFILESFHFWLVLTLLRSVCSFHAQLAPDG